MKEVITSKMVAKGIDAGIVHFVVDPNMEHGTVCQIGDYWFYFGGYTAETENPEEFLKNANQDDIVRDICYALEGIGVMSPIEHAYYYAVLNPKEFLRTMRKGDTP